MHNWNVIITVQEDGCRRALKMLQKFGPVSETDFCNILVPPALRAEGMRR